MDTFTEKIGNTKHRIVYNVLSATLQTNVNALMKHRSEFYVDYCNKIEHECCHQEFTPATLHYAGTLQVNTSTPPSKKCLSCSATVAAAAAVAVDADNNITIHCCRKCGLWECASCLSLRHRTKRTKR